MFDVLPRTCARIVQRGRTKRVWFSSRIVSNADGQQRFGNFQVGFPTSVEKSEISRVSVNTFRNDTKRIVREKTTETCFFPLYRYKRASNVYKESCSVS